MTACLLADPVTAQTLSRSHTGATASLHGTIVKSDLTVGSLLPATGVRHTNEYFTFTSRSRNVEDDKHELVLSVCRVVTSGSELVLGINDQHPTVVNLKTIIK